MKTRHKAGHCTVCLTRPWGWNRNFFIPPHICWVDRYLPPRDNESIWSNQWPVHFIICVHHSAWLLDLMNFQVKHTLGCQEWSDWLDKTQSRLLLDFNLWLLTYTAGMLSLGANQHPTETLTSLYSMFYLQNLCIVFTLPIFSNTESLNLILKQYNQSFWHILSVPLKSKAKIPFHLMSVIYK